MNILQLKEEISSILKKWHVTVDEAEMVNINIDAIDRECGYVYVEEFFTGSTTYNMGVRDNNRFEITFMVFGDIQPLAVEREQLRQKRIWPAVREVEGYLNSNYGVTTFQHNTLPKGFDANEVLVSIQFNIEEMVCQR